MDYYIFNKRELENAIEEIEENDSLIISSVDCLGNSVYDISDMIEKISNKNINFRLTSNTALNFSKEDKCLEVVIVLLKEICELQKHRVRKSVQKARNEGKIMGRRKLNKSDLPDVFVNNLNDFNLGRINKTEFAQLCKCSRPTLNKWLICIAEGD